jgi:hypothetical protein
MSLVLILLEAGSTLGSQCGRKKNSNKCIGNRTRDLPAYSALHQQTTPPCASKNICTGSYYVWLLCLTFLNELTRNWHQTTSGLVWFSQQNYYKLLWKCQCHERKRAVQNTLSSQEPSKLSLLFDCRQQKTAMATYLYDVFQTKLHFAHTESFISFVKSSPQKRL